MMTTTVVVQPVEPVSKPMPIWASVVIILLCLGAGGYIMHWYVMSDPISHESRLLANGETSAASNPINFRPNRPNPNNPDLQPYIRQSNADTWNVHSAEATVIIVHQPNKPVVIRALNYNNYEFVPQDQRTMIFSARRIFRDEAMQKTLKITPDQINRLRGLTGQITMTAAPSDQEAIKTLFTAYQASADKAGEQNKLMAALGDIARKSIEPTRATAAKRADEIKSALSADQWKQFETLGR